MNETINNLLHVEVFEASKRANNLKKNNWMKFLMAGTQPSGMGRQSAIMVVILKS